MMGKIHLPNGRAATKRRKRKIFQWTLNKKYDSLKHETLEIVKKVKNKSIYIKEESV